MSSSRGRIAKHCAACALIAAATLALNASTALARDAYVANSGSGSVSVLDTGTNVAVATIPVGAGPRDVAITPDGRFAYVTNEAGGTVSQIDTRANAVLGASIVVGGKPRGIAISPNGRTAWVANFGDGTVSVIDTRTNTVPGASIAVGKEPDGVAISPDGTAVFVAQRSGDVSMIGTATDTVLGTVADASAPAQVAIGPHGGRGFIANSGAGSVTAFSPASRQPIGAPIAVGKEPDGIAVAPSGATAYAAGLGDGTLTPINTQTNATGTALKGFNGPAGVAISPAGSAGYVVNSGGGTVTAFNTASGAPLASVPVGTAPSGIAIVPDQAPTASFSVTPALRIQNRRLAFLASASKDPDGRIVKYSWTFGDGKHLASSSARVTHRYRQPGTYTVTLTVTDDEGCSTAFVFTGQTAYCNGLPTARSSTTILVADNRGPELNLAGARRQRIRGRLNVFAQCPQESCAIRAGGRIVTTTMRRGTPVSRRRRVGSAGAALAAGQWVRLALPVLRGSRRAVLRALRSGGAAAAELRVVATDQSGLRTVRGRYIVLIGTHRRRRR